MSSIRRVWRFALGVVELLLQLLEVLGVERGAQLSERAARFTQLESSSIEVDADQAHGPSIARSSLEIDDAPLYPQLSDELRYFLVRGVLLTAFDSDPVIARGHEHDVALLLSVYRPTPTLQARRARYLLTHAKQRRTQSLGLGASLGLRRTSQ
jgi:hypothetical protein